MQHLNVPEPKPIARLLQQLLVDLAPGVVLLLLPGGSLAEFVRRQQIEDIDIQGVGAALSESKN